MDVCGVMEAAGGVHGFGIFVDQVGVGHVEAREGRVVGIGVRHVLRAHVDAAHFSRRTQIIGPGTALITQARVRPRDQLKLRLIYLALGQDEKATAPLEAADPVRAELLSTLCKTIATSKQLIQDPNEAPGQALLAAEELKRLLSEQSTVVIPKIALVTRVKSFGDYDAVVPPRYPKGAPVMYLYTEIANFRTEPTPDGRLKALLSETVEVFDATGKLVWQRTEQDIEDRVLSPRRDFYIPFPIELPANLMPGPYILKARVTDELGKTTDEQRLTFDLSPT